MELGATIAASDSDVASCFLAVGRMPELVDALASSSKAIVKANELGNKGSKGRKKSLHGGTLELWSVKSN